MKKVIFPDSKSLQPIPNKDIKPNISGNINSTTGMPTEQNSNTNSRAEQPTNQITPVMEKTTNFFTYSAIIILFIAIGVIAYRKMR